MAQGGEGWVNQAIEAATAALGLGGAVAAYMQGRKHERAAFVTAVQDAAHLVIIDLQKDREDLRREREELREDRQRLQDLCDENRGQHDACRSELAAARAEIAEMKILVAGLMQRSPPADQERPGRRP